MSYFTSVVSTGTQGLFFPVYSGYELSMKLHSKSILPWQAYLGDPEFWLAVQNWSERETQHRKYS